LNRKQFATLPLKQLYDVFWMPPLFLLLLKLIKKEKRLHKFEKEPFSWDQIAVWQFRLHPCLLGDLLHGAFHNIFCRLDLSLINVYNWIGIGKFLLRGLWWIRWLALAVFYQWGSITHQMAVPVPSISCCVLNQHNIFYQVQNALAFNWDMCCLLALYLRLLPFH
jgi:hypothetical protein